MRTVEEALTVLARAAGPPRRVEETVVLSDALGRILAEDVAVEEPVPSFAKSQMDGFAVGEGVRVGRSYPVAGVLPAGIWPEAKLLPDTAIRIMTGAPVPEGTARVVPFEWTEADDRQVTIERLPRDDAYIVPAGAHIAAGQTVLPTGSWVGPGAIGALATLGLKSVRVAARPRVALLGTGSELVGVEEQPAPGQIRNSNAVMLRAQVVRAGATPVDLAHARDEEADLAARIAEGLEADLFVLSGGVSRGDFDLVPAALEAAGVRCLFHRWRVQPGGPLWLGIRGDTVVFGLPGNPAASFVGFELLVVPAIRHRLGLPLVGRPTLRAHYRGEWGDRHRRRRYRPASLETDDEGRLHAVLRSWSGSGDPFVAARAEALVALPEDTDAPPEGERVVDVLPLEPWA